MKMILGTKVGMTNLFDEQGKRYAATVIHVEPNQVLETKTLDKDGYVATKVGYENIKDKNQTKARLGEFKKAKSETKRIIKEFRDVDGFNIGDKITCGVFEKGQYVDVQALSKGHGFSGSIKRHNFKIGPLGHGAGYPHRYVGSIAGGRGGSQGQRVFKGTELPGHYGHETITTSNLLVLDVNAKDNIIIIHGAVPGPVNGLVCVKLSKKRATDKQDVKLVNLKLKPSKPELIEEVVENVNENSETVVANESK